MEDTDGLFRTLELGPIRLEDKGVFDAAIDALRAPISDYTFAGMAMWSRATRVGWRRLHGHLCVFANGANDLSMMAPPLPDPGARDRDLGKAIGACFEMMDSYNRDRKGLAHSRIEYVSAECLGPLMDLDAMGLSPTPMWGDYIYPTGSMIDLAGGALKSKRHARSRFLKRFPEYRLEEMRVEYEELCVELLGIWLAHGDEVHEGEASEFHVGTDILRHRESVSTGYLIDHWQELGLTGMTLWVGDVLVGFTFGELLTQDQAVILVEKTHPEYPGSAQLIFSAFCERAWGETNEINVGDDWGIPGLRFTKESYRPSRRLAKYVLSREAVVTNSVMAGGLVDVPLVPSANPTHVLARPMEEVGGRPAHAAREIVIRKAVESDLDSLLELERVCFSSADERFSRRQVRSLVLNPRALVSVAELEAGDGEGARVVGWSVGLLRRQRNGKSGRLYALAVHPGMQGRMTGRRLAEHAIDALREAGAGRVYLEVRADNGPALRLYDSLGFVRTQVLPAYYGAGRDGVRMAMAGQLAPLARS